MRLQPLYDLQQEINRLFIAGSKFAKADPRLQKQVTVFEKLGEKVPVFKKIATDLQALSEIEAQQSPEALMNLSTLLYSVLYTQGEQLESDQEVQQQVPQFPIERVDTSYSYLELKPVIDALTLSNSGRLEVLIDALERNIFQDSRIYRYLDLALSDKYSDLANYVEEKIIPKVGKPMLPFLVESFEYSDKPQNIRKIRLLSQLEYPNIKELLDNIFSTSFANLRAEALTILAKDAVNEEFIISMVDDKNKTVREAAYRALATLNTENSLRKLKDLYVANKRKSDTESIANALSSTKMPFFFQEVFAKLKSAFDAVVSLDKTADDKSILATFDEFSMGLVLLAHKDYPEVYEFLEDVISCQEIGDLSKAKSGLLGDTYYRMEHKIISVLSTLDAQKVLDMYVRLTDAFLTTSWTEYIPRVYFDACINANYPKEKIYDVFYGFYTKGLIKADKLNRVHFTIAEKSGGLDPRWADVLIPKIIGAKLKWNYEANQSLLILNALEPNNSKRCETLLTELVKNVLDPRDAGPIYQIVMERKVSDRFEQIYSAVSQFKKSYYLNIVPHYKCWEEFPEEYVEKFRALYKEHKLDIFNQIATKIKSIYQQTTDNNQ